MSKNKFENITEKVAEYNLLRAKTKTIKARMDELAKDIKGYLTSNVSPDSKGNYYEEDDNFVYGNMAKKSIKLNEERTKVFLQERNLLEQASEVKVVIKEDKLEQLLANGDITMEEFKTLVDTKITYSIDIKEKKKEEEPVEVQVASSTRPKRKLPTRR